MNYFHGLYNSNIGQNSILENEEASQTLLEYISCSLMRDERSELMQPISEEEIRINVSSRVLSALLINNGEVCNEG